MKRLVLGFLCVLSLAIAPGCGGDDDGDSADGADVDSGGGGFDATGFCTDWGAACGFGDGFADQAACETAVAGWSSTRQDCVVEHLGFAEAAEEGSADRDMHCGHSAGEAPCN